MKSVDELINKNLQVANYFSFSKKKEVTPPLPIITISRQKGAGGSAIAKMLAKNLGKRWKVYGKQIVDQIATDTRVEKALVQDIDEKEIPYLDEVIGSLFGKEYLSLSGYHKSLLKVLRIIGNQGYAIIVGRGANFLFKHALKIRIIADTKQRQEWLMRYEKLTEQEAINLVKKSDKERANFTTDLFNKDVNDPSNYDLTIKTSSTYPPEEVAEWLAKFVNKKYLSVLKA